MPSSSCTDIEDPTPNCLKCGAIECAPVAGRLEVSDAGVALNESVVPFDDLAAWQLGILEEIKEHLTESIRGQRL